MFAASFKFPVLVFFHSWDFINERVYFCRNQASQGEGFALFLLVFEILVKSGIKAFDVVHFFIPAKLPAGFCINRPKRRHSPADHFHGVIENVNADLRVFVEPIKFKPERSAGSAS